ncbi:MAG: hypothetical protein ACR2P7_02685, partial [bacterium]
MRDEILKILPKALFSRESWRAIARYLPRRARRDRIADADALAAFVASRASHVAQSALYGYMKTRAGTRFPELFDHPAMLASINIAKWQMWLACLSDLAVYSAVLLHRRGASRAQAEATAARIVAAALASSGADFADGASHEAGADFADGVRAVEARVAAPGIESLGDDDSAFVESPRALVRWAPVADEFKRRDAEIIRNSVRFRWQAVRRDLRARLRADAVIAHLAAADD